MSKKAILTALYTRFQPEVVFPDKLAQEAYVVIEALIEALEGSNIALNDWITTYASEFCDEEAVKKAYERINLCGTLAYIADVVHNNRLALELAGIKNNGKVNV